MKCKLCGVRRPRRSCPGIGNDICALCCGTERENTVACPSDCEYLREARTHEAAKGVAPVQVPNSDIRITDEFVHSNSRLGGFLVLSLARAVAGLPQAVDADVREALDGLVRTYRTLESGLYYNSRPSNLLAAGIFDRVQSEVDEFRKETQQTAGMATIRDADVLGMLVFIQRLDAHMNNGRRLARVFIEFLHGQLSEFGGQAAAQQSVLVRP